MQPKPVKDSAAQSDRMGFTKGRVNDHGFNPLFEGFPESMRSRGPLDDHTFVIDWMTLGQGPTQTWTLTFAGDELNVRVKYGALPEISINGKAGQ